MINIFSSPWRINLLLRIKTLIILIVLLMSLLSFGLMPAQAQTIASLTSGQEIQLDELAKQAFNATNEGDFTAAEQYWTQIIELFPDNAAAWSNRGNSKVSQNHLTEALQDYNKAVELAPNFPDPYLNRGTALEGLQRWNEAIADYNQALQLNPKDAAVYNNRGNAKAGLGKWQDAIADYQMAMQVDPRFSLAYGNYALSLYQVGDIDLAIKTMKNILRKYPNFTDIRAALSAALWAEHKQGEAESNWVSVENIDPRYQDLQWVKEIRRWPPALTNALEKFLTLQD